MTTDQWATSSNAALRVTLVDSTHLRDAATFHPSFTYPIFGEAETVYGYENLQILLEFKSDSLLAALSIKHDDKLESKTAKVDDPRSTLLDFLPAEDVRASRSELDTLAAERGAFTPPGRKVHTYKRSGAGSAGGKGKGKARDRVAFGPPLSASAKGKAGEGERTFEVYHCDWNTPGFLEYHRRMQLFTLLFIEGASYIDVEEQRWEFLVLYEVTTSPSNATPSYHFAGYTSLYNFWFYPSWHRMRLSQFVVLPPFQGQGHGAELYGQVVHLAQERKDIVELTIEDPSEAFDRLRDTNDLKRLLSPADGFLLRAKEHTKGGALRAPIDKTWSEAERVRHKIAKRQWDRLVEMCMLMMLDETDAEQIRGFRLQVKSRLYGFNRDVLKQMEQDERVAKLQETYESVLEEYGQLTGADVDAIIEVGLEAEDEAVGGPASKMARFG